MIDKEKLLDDPRAWGKSRISTAEQQEYDERERYENEIKDAAAIHSRRVYDIRFSEQSDLYDAYQLLITHGAINEGDLAPWDRETVKDTAV